MLGKKTNRGLLKINKSKRNGVKVKAQVCFPLTFPFYALPQGWTPVTEQQIMEWMHEGLTLK